MASYCVKKPVLADLDRFSPKWPRRSRSIDTIFNRVLKGPKIHIWCKFGDPSSKIWHIIAWTSLFLADFDRFDPKWPWRSRSISTIFNWGVKDPKIHIWCKFGDPSSKPRRVIARTSPFLSIWTVLAPNDLEGQGQSTPFSIGFWRVPWYTFGANMVSLAQNGDELSCGQARFSPIWTVLAPSDLEDQGQWTPFSIGF